MKRVNLNLLESFFAVYTFSSYTKAARQLNCSIASVSNRVEKMEGIVGNPLFIKKNKTLVPTQFARQIYDNTNENFNNIEYFFKNISYENKKTNYNILTSTGGSLLWLITEIEFFSSLEEDFTYSIHATENPYLEFEENFDIIALTQNLEHPAYKKIIGYTFRTKLYASQDYIEKYGAPQTPEDLDSHKLISFYHKQNFHRGDPDWMLRLNTTSSNYRAHTISVDNALGVSHAVSLGLGIGALTENNPFIDLCNLVPVLPEYSGPPCILNIYYKLILEDTKFISYLKHGVKTKNMFPSVASL